MSVDVAAHLVQTCATLPATDAGWTSRPDLTCDECWEGVSNDPGGAVLKQYSGYGHLPGGTANSQRAIVAGLLGQYVRVLIRDDVTPGPITISSQTYTQLFLGVIRAQATEPDLATVNPGAPVMWRCLGIAAILDQIYINRGVETSFGSADGTLDIGRCPPFNAILTSNGTSGDRSDITYTLNGQSVYIHERAAPTHAWQAYDIANFIIADFAKPTLPVVGAVGPAWQLDALVNLPAGLTYIPEKLDLHGKTVFEALNLLISARRGMVWRAVPPKRAPYTDPIIIAVDSTLPSSVVVGSFTATAAASTVAIDLRGDARVEGLSIEEDASAFDVIHVEGAHPVIGISVNLLCSTATVPSPFADGDFHLGTLKRGWVSSQETTWDPYTEQGPGYTMLYRRFLFADDFNGGQYPGSATVGMRNYREFTTGASPAADQAAFGIGGYTGVRTFAHGGSPWPGPGANGLRLEPFVPLDADGGSNLRKGLCTPMLFIKDGSTWEDITGQYDISIENDPPAIVLGGDPDKIVDLATRINVAGNELVITIGVREASPLAVSWQADISTWPRSAPRVLVRSMPLAEQWLTLVDTAFAVSGGGLATVGVTVTVLDDLTKLKNYLAVLRAWYPQNAVAVTWKKNGTIDFDTSVGAKRPGTLVTTVHRGDAAIAANATFVCRRWTLSEDGYGTSYATQRILPDLDLVESELTKVHRHRGGLLDSGFEPPEYDPDRYFSGKPLARPVFIDVGTR